MPESSFIKIHTYVGSMGTLPVTVSKVLEVCNNPKTSPIDLDRVIQLDPVLMGRVLKLINSAYYGLGTQVTSLVRAIIMLGLNTVKNLALSTAIIDRFAAKKGKALNMDGFWRHSLCVGVTSKLIAVKRGVDKLLLEEYFAAGLLHDIGKIPMNDALGEDYVHAMAAADRDRIPLNQAETKLLGINHCDAGAAVSKAWKLTGAIADAIVCHHDIPNYKGEYSEVMLTVAAANYFASRDEIGFSGNRYPERLPADLWERLGIGKEVLEELEGPVTAEIEKAKIFLGQTK